MEQPTATEAETAPVTPPESTPTETPPAETVDFWKAKAREQEKRAKANADAATKLAALEESQKTETQRLADAKTAAETDAASARAEALRWRIAAKHGISDDDADTFLTGTDEETLTKQAERLSALSKDTTPPPGPRPDLSQGAKGNAAGGSPEQDFAAFLTTQMGQ